MGKLTLYSPDKRARLNRVLNCAVTYWILLWGGTTPPPERIDLNEIEPDAWRQGSFVLGASEEDTKDQFLSRSTPRAGPDSLTARCITVIETIMLGSFRQVMQLALQPPDA